MTEMRLPATLRTFPVESKTPMSGTTETEPRQAPDGGGESSRLRELLEANRRLRELCHRKDDALAVCAHDLRSPLNVVLGHVRLLLRGSRGALSSSQRQSIETIERQVGRMVELVEDLLDLRALSLGRMELDRRPTELGALCEEITGSLGVLASARGLSLDCQVPCEPIEASVDPPKLREVLTNLITNALRLTSPPGRVILSLSVQGPEAALEVRDTGPGIPADDLPQLFDPAPRRRTDRRAGSGDGLGLPICREIVELHGGRIEARNHPGGGASFIAHLPLREQPPLPEDAARPTLLLAEDDPDARSLVADLLAERYDVVQAADGDEALRLARARPPEVVVMDLFMPRLDGFAALEELRRDPRTSEIPVILLSAQSDDMTKVRGLDLGAADYLVKPLSGPELLARVAKAREQRRQRDQYRAMAQSDALTGLPNFRAFRARLDEEVRRASRYATPLSMVMIDLDQLKALNDERGHAAGNQALTALASVVRQELRGSDFAARYGGDEFVILLPHTEAIQAGRFAERLRAEVRRTGERTLLPLGISAGVAEAVPDHADAGALLEAADAALYQAKRAGRDRVVVAPPAPGPRNH
ncbi:MAG: sensor domain-containing diguanylate cyclase [Myxococcales bacterium]